MTTPTGGVVKYTVADGERGPGYYEGQHGAGAMLRTRETWGPGVVPGTWTFGVLSASLHELTSAILILSVHQPARARRTDGHHQANAVEVDAT